MTGKRLKVLISAHELSPIQGSECAEGWNLVTRLAQYHDVTVLYAKGSQFEPESYEKAVTDWMNKHGKIQGLEFIAIPQPKMTLFLATINRILSGRKTGIGIPFLYYWGYNQWQRKAYHLVRKFKSYPSKLPHDLTLNLKALSRNFDIIHHLTQITFREPGYLWKLGIPYIWGPTGGLEGVPTRFARSRGGVVFVKELVRKMINFSSFKLKPRIRMATRRAELIYTFSRYDLSRFGKAGAQRVELMMDAGTRIKEGIRRQASGSNKLKVIWVGQLVERKVLDILIEAVNSSEELKSSCEVTIVGDGPLRKKYELSGFNFVGQIPHEEVKMLMEQSDILVHTSYREATSNVIPEALSVGLPVICHDISGMSIAIDKTCGIKVPLVSKQDSILGFRKALLSLTKYQVPNTQYQLANLKKGAIKRAQNLSWDTMAAEIATHYHELAG